MKSINKQRFLAELGKLLTFMYDEDKQTALGMYADLFDSYEDNVEELAKALVSPTRQAVVIARAYDPSEREEEDEYGEEPGFLRVIRNTIDDAEKKLKGTANVSDDQFTFFSASGSSASEGKSYLDSLGIDGIDVDDDITYGTVGDEREDEDYIEELADDRSADTKFSGGMLALFLVLAIPLGLVAIALTVVLAALLFAIAVAAGFLAFYAISAAFNSGFDIIADILLIAGVAVILAAIGILALWTGIWLLFGGIPGLVRNTIELGGRFCHKEVAA